MSKIGEIVGRLGASVLHVLLNALLSMVRGKYFGAAWERLGRTSTFETGEALLVVSTAEAVAEGSSV